MAFNENSYWLKPPAASNTGRALTFGGYSSQNVIDYFNSGSAGNATDFGDLSNGGSEGEAQANGTYALFYLGRGSSTNNNIIEKVNISSTGNSADYGDAIETTRDRTGSCSSSTISLNGGGYGNSGTDTIDKKLFATDGNATDFGY